MLLYHLIIFITVSNGVPPINSKIVVGVAQVSLVREVGGVTRTAMIQITRLTWQVSSALFSTMLFLDMSFRNNIETVGSVGGAFDEEFDFIVVGAGSAGAAIAARLAETRARVLLVEAGGEQPYKATIPWFHLWLAGSTVDWGYETERGAGRGYEGGQE